MRPGPGDPPRPGAPTRRRPTDPHAHLAMGAMAAPLLGPLGLADGGLAPGRRASRADRLVGGLRVAAGQPDAEDRVATHVAMAQRKQQKRADWLGVTQVDPADPPPGARYVPDMSRRRSNDSVNVVADPSFFDGVSLPNAPRGRNYHADSAHATAVCNVNPDECMEVVRERVADALGVPPQWVRLRFAGAYVTKVKAYPTGRRTPRELGIADGDVVHASPKMHPPPPRTERKADRRARLLARAALACGAAHEPWPEGVLYF